MSVTTNSIEMAWPVWGWSDDSITCGVEAVLEIRVDYDWSDGDRQVGDCGGVESYDVFVKTDDDEYVKIPALNPIWRSEDFRAEVDERAQQQEFF